MGNITVVGRKKLGKMAIIETINSSSHFYHWLKQNSSYKDNFSYNGAVALQEYLDQLSDDTGENIEFDPIAWCVEYSEYEDVDDFNDQYFGEEYKKGSEYTLETLQDSTTVIEFDGGIVVQDF